MSVYSYFIDDMFLRFFTYYTKCESLAILGRLLGLCTI